VGGGTCLPGPHITESDVVNFAGLSGDFVELHTNEDVSRASPLRKRLPTGC